MDAIFLAPSTIPAVWRAAFSTRPADAILRIGQHFRDYDSAVQ
jgi:hypothetical protein